MTTMRPPVRRSDINITPLIDVLLVLLVIFMVITPLTPNGLDAEIPQPMAERRSESASASIVVSVDADGNIRINHEAVEARDLRSRIEDAFRSRRDRVVFLDANPRLLFNDVAFIVDVATGAGASGIGLLTEPTE